MEKLEQYQQFIQQLLNRYTEYQPTSITPLMRTEQADQGPG